MNARLQCASRRLESWLRQDALPLWADSGFCAAAQASYERLLPDGSPDRSASVRALVQARQMLVYAMAHHLGWSPRGREIACQIMDFVERVAVHPGDRRGYVHMLDCRFEVIDPTPDLYDHAFFILAYAWCYRAFGLRSALDRAKAAVCYLDEEFKAGNGGWNEGGHATDRRRQNPHMHLFEAFLALYDVTGDRHWLGRADELFRLFKAHFYDPSTAVTLEYFNDDWTPLTAAEGQVVEPGHMMEWVWLLRCYEQRARTPVSAIADALYEKALEIGMSPDSGLLFDAVAADGQVIKPSKRCWPMTEYIKASLAQARAGRAGAEDRAAEAIEKLFVYYLCAATPGACIDQRGASDEITVDVAAASTLYHLIVAGSEASAWRIAGR